MINWTEPAASAKEVADRLRVLALELETAGTQEEADEISDRIRDTQRALAGSVVPLFPWADAPDDAK